jgi:hypothetical protein
MKRKLMEIKEMEVKRKKTLNELSRLSGWVTGSLVKTERTQSGKKSPFHYLSRSLNGSNRITYVAAEDLETFTKILETGKRARRLFEQITELTIAIIKAECKQKKGQRR